MESWIIEIFTLVPQKLARKGRREPSIRAKFLSVLLTRSPSDENNTWHRAETQQIFDPWMT